jgi:integrase/recombinase XerD
MGSGRTIPIHGRLRDAIRSLAQRQPTSGPVILSERGGPMTPLSVVVWFARAYDALGFDG